MPRAIDPLSPATAQWRNVRYRVGLRDTFAEGARTAPYLFARYGLSTQAVIDAAWAALGRTGHVPVAEVAPAEDGEHAPV